MRVCSTEMDNATEPISSSLTKCSVCISIAGARRSKRQDLEQRYVADGTIFPQSVGLPTNHRRRQVPQLSTLSWLRLAETQTLAAASASRPQCSRLIRDGEAPGPDSKVHATHSIRWKILLDLSRRAGTDLSIPREGTLAERSVDLGTPGYKLLH